MLAQQLVKEGQITTFQANRLLASETETPPQIIRPTAPQSNALQSSSSQFVMPKPVAPPSGALQSGNDDELEFAPLDEEEEKKASTKRDRGSRRARSKSPFRSPRRNRPARRNRPVAAKPKPTARPASRPQASSSVPPVQAAPLAGKIPPGNQRTQVGSGAGLLEGVAADTGSPPDASPKRRRLFRSCPSERRSRAATERQPAEHPMADARTSETSARRMGRGKNQWKRVGVAVDVGWRRPVAAVHHSRRRRHDGLDAHRRQDILKAADAAYKNGEYAQAIHSYNEYLEKQPKASLPHVRIGMATLRQAVQAADWPAALKRPGKS